MSVIRSVSDNQEEILVAIRDLHCGGKFDCDCTYGNGAFYKNIEKPKLCFDLQPLHPNVVKASCDALPLPDSYLESVVADLPFLTYVREGREGNGSMVMSRRFAGYWSYNELAEHYANTIKEVSRVLKKKGILVFKCQDIVHDHALRATHVNSIRWAEQCGFRLLDLFVLTATHRMPSPNRKGKQQHARVWHSYFLVFKKL